MDARAADGEIIACHCQNGSRRFGRNARDLAVDEVVEHDVALVVGPVLPHEVVGISGGNKYFFPGVAGQQIIDVSHWVGALITSAEIIGTTAVTPVRALIDDQGNQVKEAGPSVPVAVLGLSEPAESGDRFVIAPDEKTGFCLGDRYDTDPTTTLPAEPDDPLFTGRCGLGDGPQPDAEAVLAHLVDRRIADPGDGCEIVG